MTRPTKVKKDAFSLRLYNKAYRHTVLFYLYEQQTPDEQSEKQTKWNNGVGFNHPDGKALASLAERILRGQKLTRAEERVLKKRLPKYWGQFTETTLVERLTPGTPKERPGKATPHPLRKPGRAA